MHCQHFVEGIAPADLLLLLSEPVRRESDPAGLLSAGLSLRTVAVFVVDAVADAAVVSA